MNRCDGREEGNANCIKAYARTNQGIVSKEVQSCGNTRLSFKSSPSPEPPRKSRQHAEPQARFENIRQPRRGNLPRRRRPISRAAIRRPLQHRSSGHSYPASKLPQPRVRFLPAPSSKSNKPAVLSASASAERSSATRTATREIPEAARAAAASVSPDAAPACHSPNMAHPPKSDQSPPQTAAPSPRPIQPTAPSINSAVSTARASPATDAHAAPPPPPFRFSRRLEPAPASCLPEPRTNPGRDLRLVRRAAKEQSARLRPESKWRRFETLPFAPDFRR